MKICVFLGSAIGNHPAYIQAVKELGAWVAKNNHALIYGGSRTGLMGLLADAALEHGGHVQGYACKDFEKVLHPELTKTIVFNTLAERKTAIINDSDIFIAFPGGLGTMDELFEVWTMAKAKLSHKPIGILNVNNIFTPLHQAIEKLTVEGFITEEQFKLTAVANNVNDLMSMLCGDS